MVSLTMSLMFQAKAASTLSVFSVYPKSPMIGELHGPPLLVVVPTSQVPLASGKRLT
jgi:hypothetical protein